MSLFRLQAITDNWYGDWLFQADKVIMPSGMLHSDSIQIIRATVVLADDQKAAASTHDKQNNDDMNGISMK